MGNEQKGAFQDHVRLGTIQIERNPMTVMPEESDGEAIQIYNMLMKIPLESQRVWQDWLSEMKSVDGIETRETILLPDKYEFSAMGMCGSSGTAKLTFEYYEHNLESEIKNRVTTKNILENGEEVPHFFRLVEMWFILYNMVRAAKRFEQLKRKIGNVHPSNILINGFGNLKIISTSSFPTEVDNYSKKIEKQDENVFLAPQEIIPDFLARGQYPSNVDPCRAEMFSIGLTLLSCGTLEDCDRLYLRNPTRLNTKDLSQIAQSLTKNYSSTSPLLVKIIKSMLEINPNIRASASSIYEKLSPYEDLIIQLEPFEANFEPETRQSLRSVQYNQVAQSMVNRYDQQNTPQVYMRPPADRNSQYSSGSPNLPQIYNAPPRAYNPPNAPPQAYPSRQQSFQLPSQPIQATRPSQFYQ